MHESVDDNKYPVGASITARSHPTQKLIIHDYMFRIYYCAVDGKPDHPHYAYFENELIPPVDFDGKPLKNV